jgi:protein tyrosine phosphatase
MSIKKAELEKLFVDHELCQVLAAGKKKVSKDEVAANLFKSQQKEKLIPIFLAALQKNVKNEDASKIVKEYRHEYKKFAQSLSPAIKAKSKEVFKLFEKKVGKGKKAKEVHGFDKFPSEWCHLADCKKKADDKKGIEKIQDAIKERSDKTDPAVAKKKYHYIFSKASEVVIPNRQTYILAASPKSEKDIGQFYDALLKKNVRVIITANQVGEGGGCPAYWTNAVLKKVNLSDGWSIESVESKSQVHASGKDGSKIVERKLLLTKGSQTKELAHLHYEKWLDKHASPDVDLLHKLLDVKDGISPEKHVPFLIHCRAGQGRTGAVAILDYARREIKEQLKAGKKLNDIRLNIPEMIYEMRKQRPKILGRVAQVQQVYAALGKYYEHLKQKQ